MIVDQAGASRAASNAPSTAPATSVLFEIFALNQAAARLLSEAMREGPLAPGDYAVYSAIFELEAASPTRLAARLGMRLTTFVDRLREIERRGHARRLPSPTDRRSYRVTLTAAGLEAHRGANLHFERAASAFEAALAADIEQARRMLGVMRDAADRARGAVDRAPEAADRALDVADRALDAGSPSPRPSAGRAG